MAERGAPVPRVGVRELRQNLSVYLDRVKAGETLEVTEHGRPVAQLSPQPALSMTVIERLIAEGRATPPTRDLADVGPPPRLPEGIPSPTETLLRMRDEERG
jgi:prevent-host-death family protein